MWKIFLICIFHLILFSTCFLRLIIGKRIFQHLSVKNYTFLGKILSHNFTEVIAKAKFILDRCCDQRIDRERKYNQVIVQSWESVLEFLYAYLVGPEDTADQCTSFQCQQTPFSVSKLNTRCWRRDESLGENRLELASSQASTAVKEPRGRRTSVH